MESKLLVALLCLSAPALAQRQHHGEHEGRHEVAVFVGGTVEPEEDGARQTFVTFGGEYEYRFLPRLGISAEIERIDGADTEVFAFPAVAHVYRGLMVLAGPGWENAPRREINLGDESRFLIRTGVQYSFHVGGRFAVIPALDVDFVKRSEQRTIPEHGHEAEGSEGGWERFLVFGVKIGWGF